MKKSLSIIIPYYNAMPYTKELLDVLSPQITDEIEVIVVDDGSRELFETDYPWVKVIHKSNGGCASARNVGLDHAHGEYISFIDADDMVSRDFIQKVLEKTKQSPQPDVIDLSWKSLVATACGWILLHWVRVQALQKRNSQRKTLRLLTSLSISLVSMFTSPTIT